MWASPDFSSRNFRNRREIWLREALLSGPLFFVQTFWDFGRAASPRNLALAQGLRAQGVDLTMRRNPLAARLRAYQRAIYRGSLAAPPMQLTCRRTSNLPPPLAPCPFQDVGTSTCMEIDC